MTTAHTTRARQRNDRDLAVNEQKIETVQAKLDALNAEREDLHQERAALLAMANSLRVPS